MAAATFPPHSSQSTTVLRCGGSTCRVELRVDGPRDVALIIASEPLRSALVARARAGQVEVFAPVAPLDAIQFLETHRDRIAYAIIAADKWGPEFPQFVADEYPEIHPITLVA